MRKQLNCYILPKHKPVKLKHNPVSELSVRAQEMGTHREIDKYGVRIGPESRESRPVETRADSNNEVWPYLRIQQPDRGRQQAFR